MCLSLTTTHTRTQRVQEDLDLTNAELEELRRKHPQQMQKLTATLEGKFSQRHAELEAPSARIAARAGQHAPLGSGYHHPPPPGPGPGYVSSSAPPGYLPPPGQPPPYTPAPLHHPAHSRGIKRHSKHPLRGRRVAGAAPSRLHQSSLLRCRQIPPGLQGTESEAMYAKRMGMAKNDAKL